MARRKGKRSKRQVDSDFPHQVEIAIPEGGLGRTIDRMHDLARGLGRYATRGGERRRDGPDAVRFCFADPAAAGLFQSAFGGVILTTL